MSLIPIINSSLSLICNNLIARHFQLWISPKISHWDDLFVDKEHFAFTKSNSAGKKYWFKMSLKKGKGLGVKWYWIY